ncbi:pyridoxamine 5'-phosphate oxidase family protein [Desulforamulus ruminis]|uniref:Pyridoxamine 5'-phosphate oxidase-related FMN-binding protein n=1 Tax=Desulforamulus ruminis (strain ATCC 23193 / DSM 2154 / NCIMB 8452 / DL) TaxID=696281 RepID=F6DV21_DESRL|nr:pyridoxamine 5'-phosphate oxidase family protein [Desulforamulus ruminis]AEG59087.1 pyridoxamine 5'-phosphate oxidase-related FMN-binding protein [Desulforamulus ruminis DSM 2154]
MNEVLKFLTDNPVFYIATVDGDVPKVRPFGFVMEYEGKLCFCTNNQKDVYKQLKANPNVEISTTSKTGEWLRLKGKVVFNTSKQSKQAALEAAPALSKMYSVDDSIFEIFYIENAEATFRDFNGGFRTIQF